MLTGPQGFPDELRPLHGRPAVTEQRKRLGEDFPDSYALQTMMLDRFLDRKINDDEMSELFLKTLHVPIRTFEDHIRILKQRNRPTEDLSTTEIKVRDGEVERAKLINAEVAKCEELRVAFLKVYLQVNASEAEIWVAGQELRDALERLDEVVRKTEPRLVSAPTEIQA